MRQVYIVAITVGMSCLTLMQPIASKTKTDTEVFAKWIEWQKVFKDCSLVKASYDFDKNYWGRFVNRYNAQADIMESFTPFLQNATGARLIKGKISQPSADGKMTLAKIYSWLDNDIHSMLQYMKEHNILNEDVNDDEQDADIDDVIKKYKSLLKVFFNHKDKKIREQYLFAFANRMFESCFSTTTFDKFHAILNDDTSHQLGRFCYVPIWFYLVGEGWKHWHDDCLKMLTAQAQAGKEIVYIAGGNDIYELLRRGIYKIRVIDPMLPSQPEYYAEGWDWLLKDDVDNGIGDRLELNIAANKMVMKREKYQENGSFSASLSTGETVTLPNSVTEWSIYDASEKQKLGYVIFERRFCNQSDFSSEPNKVILASFNEMYFVSMPQHLYGWGIDLKALPDDLTIYVKQLRKLVTKKIMENLAKGEDSSFTFIMLGSCAT